MARVNITVPDAVIERARAAGLNVSRLATAALEDELTRIDKMAALERYLAELDQELGPMSAHEMAEAEAWADATFGPLAPEDDLRRPA